MHAVSGIAAAAFLFLFPSQVSSFIFRSLPEAEGAELSSLVRALAFAAVLLSAVQTLSACLTGQGRAKTAAISMAIGVAIKLGLELVLLRVPQISVRGAAYAALACYLFALIFNLLYSIRERKNRLRLYGERAEIRAYFRGCDGCGIPSARAYIVCRHGCRRRVPAGCARVRCVFGGRTAITEEKKVC